MSTSNYYSIPPPPLTIIGGTSSTVTITQPQIYKNNNTSSSSSTSSIIIVIIVIASAIIVSASLYLLLRLISKRFRTPFRTFSTLDDVVVINPQSNSATTATIFTSLPLFTFSSVNGKVNGGDCAVCLSKFEPDDQLRLLPVCCHAFHSRCIDTWLESNLTCPLCRSTVVNTDDDVLNKALSASVAGNHNTTNSNGNSFRLEIGSISHRRPSLDQGQRSYSIGSFDYIIDDGYEVEVSVSDCTSVDKEPAGVQPPATPGDNLAAEVASNRSWLREYVDRALSFRSSGRIFTGSSRRTTEGNIPVEDLEASRIGEEIGELFRWFSGV